MSRIGKKPVQIPAGVTVTIDGTTVSAKGSKGELTRTFSDLVGITQEGDVLTVARVDESKESNAQQGLVRTLIHNMVVGVSEGFEKKLELTGVAQGQGPRPLPRLFSPRHLRLPREHLVRGARQHPHHGEGHLQGAGRSGCRRDPREASA